jgi:hypothetical protein
MNSKEKENKRIIWKSKLILSHIRSLYAGNDINSPEFTKYISYIDSVDYQPLCVPAYSRPFFRRFRNRFPRRFFNRNCFFSPGILNPYSKEDDSLLQSKLAELDNQRELLQGRLRFQKHAKL